MALNLYYLMSAFSESNYHWEQQAMSVALRIFHANPIVRSPAGVPPWELTLTMEHRSYDEMSRLWQATTSPDAPVGRLPGRGRLHRSGHAAAACPRNAVANFIVEPLPAGPRGRGPLRHLPAGKLPSLRPASSRSPRRRRRSPPASRSG